MDISCVHVWCTKALAWRCKILLRCARFLWARQSLSMSTRWLQLSLWIVLLVAIVSSSSWLLLPLFPAPIAWAPTSIARWSHIAAGTCHADLAALSSQRGDACWTGVQQFQERKALPLCWVYLGLLRVSLCAIRAAFPPVAVFGQEGCCAHTGKTYTCTHVCPLCIFKHTGV